MLVFQVIFRETYKVNDKLAQAGFEEVMGNDYLTLTLVDDCNDPQVTSIVAP